MLERLPRPLPLHLSASLGAWGGAAPAALALLSGTPAVHASTKGRLDTLKGSVTKGDEDQFVRAVAEKAQARLTSLMRGLSLYQAHPYRRTDPEREQVWQRGSATLLAGPGSGAPLMLVPSLVNPSTILDLMPGRSSLETLQDLGYRGYLVDWGDGSGAESDFDIEDYVCRRLVPALEYLANECGGPVPLIGYCMGGTLCLAAAALRPDLVSSLVLLAAPWDFHAEPNHPGPRHAPLLLGPASFLPPGVGMPVDWLQSFFASLDPTLNDRKFRAFADLDQSSDAATFFVALEDWAGSGPPLARKVAVACLKDWYRDNLPGRGLWILNGIAIDPSAIRCPRLVVAPRADRLVPAPVALAAAVSGAETLDPGAGHVGMVVGRKARTGLWEPVAHWLSGVAER